MSKLRIFNPEHDMALAFGGTNYTPTPMARRLRHDLQLLPAWISNNGEKILSQTPDADMEWLSHINSKYGYNLDIASVQDIKNSDEIAPWGWNHYLRRRLQLDEAKESALPSISAIDNIRTLSHRKISIDIHNRFLEAIPSLEDNIPSEFFNIDDVLDFARKHPCAYTKAPWSSSGKGIYRALDINGLDFTRWCSGIIKRQGSIMCEKPLNSVQDFAMEFECKNGKTYFIGYSIFNNDTHSSFSGGIVASTESLHNKLISILGNNNLLSEIRLTAVKILDSIIAPHYSGYAGLDMMIYRNSHGITQINPCIELNLRTTMGVVTSIIGNRLVSPQSHGRFNIEFHKSVISKEYINTINQNNPLKFTNDGKIISGVQFLTPLYNDSQYCAYIQISESSL